jgi:hypothetical protein
MYFGGEIKKRKEKILQVRIKLCNFQIWVSNFEEKSWEIMLVNVAYAIGPSVNWIPN